MNPATVWPQREYKWHCKISHTRFGSIYWVIFQNGREHCKHEQRSASYHLSLLQLIAEWPWCLFSWQTYQYVSIRFKKTRNRFSKVSACDPQPSSSSAPLRAFRLFPASCMSCHVLGQGTLPKTMHSQKENKQNQNKKDEKKHESVHHHTPRTPTHPHQHDSSWTDPHILLRNLLILLFLILILLIHHHCHHHHHHHHHHHQQQQP